MAASPFILFILTFLFIANGLSFLLSHDAGHSSGRVRRSARKEQFCCDFPWNATFNSVYIDCNVINETKDSGYAFPLRHEDPVPDFRFALLCPEAEGGADAEESDECTCPGDRKDDLVHCLEGPKQECESRCIFDKLGAVTSEGVPVMEKIERVVFMSLNQDENFKSAVNGAVQACSCKYQKMLRRYGQDLMEKCTTSDILSYCVDYEIAKRCPEKFKKSFNTDGECD